VNSPKKIVARFLVGGHFESGHLAGFRIEPGHDMVDGSVFSGSIRTLQYHEKCVVARRPEQRLLLEQALDVAFQDGFVASLGGNTGGVIRIVMSELQAFSGLGKESFREIFIRGRHHFVRRTGGISYN
jgi:hypothetical protein